MHAMEKDGGILSVSLEPMVIDSTIETLSGSLKSEQYLQLTVTDTGTGMDPEIFHRLLDPFFTTKEPGEGTGLGLAVVHGIVKSMEGGMIIESSLGQGSTVRVIMPILHGVQAIEPKIVTTGSTVKATGNILVVDDEISVTRVTELVLQSEGFSVTTFNDTHSALKKMESDPKAFDLAVLDYTMPGKTGLQLAQDFHALNPTMPIILATGLLDKTLDKRLKPSNIVAIIQKPFDLDELIDLINRTLYIPEPVV